VAYPEILCLFWQCDSFSSLSQLSLSSLLQLQTSKSFHMLIVSMMRLHSTGIYLDTVHLLLRSPRYSLNYLADEISHTHYNNLYFFSFSSRNRILETSMGTSADPLFHYPPPNDHKLALVQASFASHESGIKTLKSPFSKHRYPRCYTGMAPSSLAPATCNCRLGQTLAPLAISPIEVLSSHSPPLQIPKT
jgi:hypothetical protein